MDVLKLIELATRLNLPGLVVKGVAFVAEVRANADRAAHVLSDGELAELDAIHAEALAMADALDTKLAGAERLSHK